jgi:tetratricopeptide (TPR) repeat protein
LGTVYHKKNNNEEAIKYYKKCVEVNPTHTSAYNGMGMVEAVLGRYEEAIGNFKKCI